MKEFTSGAKSSEEQARYDLIPHASLRRQAIRMGQGAATHGDRNYEKGVDDDVFIRDRQNHLVRHAVLYANGDRSDDHLGAILANAGMCARLEELRDSRPARSEFIQAPQAGDLPSGHWYDFTNGIWRPLACAID